MGTVAGAPEVDPPVPGVCVDGGAVPCAATSFRLELGADVGGVGPVLGAGVGAGVSGVGLELGAELGTDVGGNVHTGLRQGSSSGLSFNTNLRTPRA